MTRRLIAASFVLWLTFEGHRRDAGAQEAAERPAQSDPAGSGAAGGAVSTEGAVREAADGDAGQSESQGEEPSAESDAPESTAAENTEHRTAEDNAAEASNSGQPAEPAAASGSTAPAPDVTASARSVSQPEARTERIAPPTGRLRVRRQRLKGPDRYQFGFIAGARFRNSPEYSLINQTTAARTVGFQLGVDVFQRDALHLAAEFHWTHEIAQFRRVQEIETDLRTDDFEMAVRAHYDLLSWLGLHARVGAGFTHGRLGLRVDAGPTLRSASSAFFGTFGGGVTLRLPPGTLRRVTLGVTGEAGYRLAAPLSPRVTTSEAEGEHHPIEASELSLGRIARNAPYVLVTFFIRY